MGSPSADMRVIRAAALAGAALLLAGGGCSESDEARPAIAATCALDSDCSQSLVCILGRCHVQCATSKDCPGGARCIEVGRGDASTVATRVCELEGEDAGGSAGGNTGSGGSTGAGGTGGSTGSSGGSAGSSGGASGSGGAGTGGATDAGVDGGGVSGDATMDANDAAREASPPPPDGPRGVTSCPPDAPSGSSLCVDGLACSYGTDPRPSCRTQYTCVGENWQVVAPACSPVRGCESYTTAPKTGGTCPAAGDSCLFRNGTVCACPLSPRQWNCAALPMAPCPAVAPNVGQPCDATVTPRCIYGVCFAEVSTIASCTDGSWTLSPPVCVI